MDEKIIRFADLYNRELFTLPNEGVITLYPPDGRNSWYSCRYTDNHHAVIGKIEYNIIEFVSMQERNGVVFAPNDMRPEDACGIYEIYQIKDIQNTHYAFRSFKEAENYFDPLDYRRVYASMFAPGTTLEELFTRHNNDNRPFNDKIRSMSMSDLVIVSRNGESTAHYVDNFGFTEVPQFFEPQMVSETNKQTVSRYTITVRIPINDKVFVLAENPKAVSPYVTWQSYSTHKGCDLGHYYKRRKDAVKDLYKRVCNEKDNTILTPNKHKNRDDAR